MICCSECGAKNPDGSRFCQNCGKLLFTNKSSERSKIPKKNFWNQQTKKGKIIISIVVICVILSLITLSLIYLQTTKTSHYDDENLAFNYISGWKLVNGSGNSNKLIEGTYNYAGLIQFSAEKDVTINETLDDLKKAYTAKIKENGWNITSEKIIQVDGTNAYQIDSIKSENRKSIQQRKIMLVKNSTLFSLLFKTESDLFSYRQSIDTITSSIHFKIL